MTIQPDDPRPRTDVAPAASRALLALLDRPVDESTLLLAGAAAAAAATRSGGRTRTVVVFALGGELFALSTARLRRADRPATARPIPHRRASHLRGLCAVRGEVALCIDLRVVLEMPQVSTETPSAGSRMLVLGDAGRAWAVQVDALLGVQTIDLDGVRPPPATVAEGPAAFVEGLFESTVGGATRQVALLSVERLLPAMERGLA